MTASLSCEAMLVRAMRVWQLRYLKKKSTSREFPKPFVPSVMVNLLISYLDVRHTFRKIVPIHHWDTSVSLDPVQSHMRQPRVCGRFRLAEGLAP